MKFLGYERQDGSVGIRNKILIISVDECCEGIARAIAGTDDSVVVLTNAYTCMLGGNEETFHQMAAVGQNPNVSGVLVLAMGCGSIQTSRIADPIAATGRSAAQLVCEKEGGTRKTVEAGRKIVRAMSDAARREKRREFPMSRLVIGVKCGGSDTSSGIASNPSVGAAVDKLIDMGAVCIGGELFELQGCEKILRGRAVSEQVADKIERLIFNEKMRWSVAGTELETMSIGNCVGGLTTIEEKSMGALHKMGCRPIEDILQINKSAVERPQRPGFYLSEASMLCGGAGINFAALGAHLLLWTTGAAGFNHGIVPVIRISGNKDLINEDIDVDASGIMDGSSNTGQVSDLIIEQIKAVADGQPTRIEGIGDSAMTLYQKDQRVEALLQLE